MNTNHKDAWYHCGHCGSLFQSDYGFDEERLCEVCNRKPGVGLWPVVSSVSPVASAKVAGFHKTGDKVKKIARTTTSPKRKTRAIFWFAMIWMVVLVGIVGLRYFLAENTPKKRNLDLVDLNRNLTAADREKILDQAFGECEQVIRGFLDGKTVDERTPYIARSLDLKTVLEQQEKDQLFPRLDAGSITCTEKEWIRLGDEWMVSTKWSDADGGSLFDAVFRKEFEGWKLDWLHFSRFSEASWKLFLVGEGRHDQAEFRLLARQDQDASGTGLNEERMMIVLAASEWGKPAQVVDESPAISIDLMSDEGRMLKAAFELRSQNRSVGGGELSPLDPEGYVRVRVRMSRDELAGRFRLTLDELKACHWMDSDLSGL